ncbi:hypothetical protein AGMMS50212_16990 [Spirochaetia bacterium]|nr:hypothetical protein AGMMS50212_16990 [Spirochaetia bacterium]
MTSWIVIAAAAVMLILLFLKIPVFISVLAGSVTYFMLHPELPAQIMAQRNR